MTPAQYLEHLENTSLAEKFPSSELRPHSSVEVLSIERETQRQFPPAYVEFVCEIGTGDEFGGLARWLHLDVARPNNVLDYTNKIKESQLSLMAEAGRPASKYPKDFIVFYDSLDDAVYGFCLTDKEYQENVFCWDCEIHEIDEVAATFSEFLDYLAEAASD